MLEQMVQKFRGVILFFVVFALSAVFVLQFGGPQAKGCSEGGGHGVAAEVYGETISRSEFQSARTLAGGEGYPPELAKQNKLDQMVLYGLIERDLLAHEARKLGYYVSEDEVLQRIADDGTINLSMSVDAGPYLPPSGPQRFSFKDKDGEFSKENLKNFIQYRLRRSVHEFARTQVEETLAQRTRELVNASVTVGDGELWDAFVREKENVTLQYVRFSNTYYAQQLEPSDADIRAFMKGHKQEVDAEYEKEKHRYTGLEKQVRARHILIKVPSDADDATKQAAREKAQALLARARAGEDFATLARKYSEDEGSAKKGGDLGFNPKGRMVKPFDEAQFALKPGEISDVVESTFGFHIIKVEAIREGDVPVDEAKRELAEKLYRAQKAAELAKQSADALLKKVEGGETLEDATAQLSGKSAPPAEGEGEDTAKSDPLAPQVRETRPFGRTDTPIAGPFDSTPLVKAAYGLSEQKPLPDAPMRLGDDWFVYRLQSRNLATKEAFTNDEQQRLRAALLRRRQHETLTAYVRTLRAKALANGGISVEATLLPSDAQPAGKGES